MNYSPENVNKQRKIDSILTAISKILIRITRYLQANSEFAEKLTNFNFTRYSPTRLRSRCN